MSQNRLKQFWEFLKKDTWQSWIVSLVLIIIFIKFIFFPTLSFLSESPLPLVVVESCSMYHESDFESWWDQNSEWYKSRGIEKEDFESFQFKNGLNKGDIIFVTGRGDYDTGDIIIFEAPTKYPIIHRLVSEDPFATKGDHNTDQLSIEQNIPEDRILGKAVIRIPLVGWLKLIFYEPFRDTGRGFC